MKRIFRNPIALAFSGIGILTLGLAFHFNVNPVDCGAVRGGLQHHPSLFIPLAVATIPAMFIGMLALAIGSGNVDHPGAYFAGAFISQFILYFTIGLAISGTVRLIKKRNKQTPNQASQPIAGKPGSG